MRYVYYQCLKSSAGMTGMGSFGRVSDSRAETSRD